MLGEKMEYAWEFYYIVSIPLFQALSRKFLPDLVKDAFSVRKRSKKSAVPERYGTNIYFLISFSSLIWACR